MRSLTWDEATDLLLCELPTFVTGGVSALIDGTPWTFDGDVLDGSNDWMPADIWRNVMFDAEAADAMAR